MTPRAVTPQHSSNRESADAAQARRARRVFVVVVAAYVAILGIFFALGVFGFVWKTVIVPSLFVVAYVAGRLRAFVRDWAVFLGAVSLFDSARGLVYGLTLKLSLPVHMAYAINLEEALFGTPVPSIRLQRALLHAGSIGWIEKALVLVHASHFLAFLFFALLVWLVRRQDFSKFKLAMLIVMFGGVLIYALLPTVPPWMAAGRFHVIEPISHVPKLVYNVSMPTVAAAFDVNPVAAMPSLHAAFPTLLTLVCFRHFGRRGLVMGAYTLAVFFAIVCLGEHYVVDVLAGVALAVFAYFLAYRRRAAVGRAPASDTRADASSLTGPLLGCTFLIVLAQVTGGIARMLQDRELNQAERAARAVDGDPVSEDFVVRELDGKSPMTNYFRGLHAFQAGDFPRAQVRFATSVSEVPDPEMQVRANRLLGVSAFHNRDYRRAVDALAAESELPPEEALMLAEARLQLGQRELGFQALDDITKLWPETASRREKRLRLERAYGRYAPAQ
jgi:hypothetical protein